MKLTEMDAKRLLKQVGIAIPTGFLLSSDQQDWPSDRLWSGPVMLKAQVLQGRRGKRGLVVRCDQRADVSRELADMRSRLGEIPSAGVLCEQVLPHASELFLAIQLNRLTRQPEIHVSFEGGIDVAQTIVMPCVSIEAVARLSLAPSVKQLVRQLWTLFHTHDVLSLEINPLALLADGSCVALDAKIEIDDAAAVRHPEWSWLQRLPAVPRPWSAREEAYQALVQTAGHRGTLGQYVELDGDIAMVLSGGGASLAAMDALHRAGGRPANYVELSGNPDPAMVQKAVEIVLSHPQIRGLWIAGSYANFTDIQATVGACLQAVAKLGLRFPIVIRRDGPQAEEAEQEALRWAQRQAVPLAFHRGHVDFDASAAALMAMFSV